MLTCKGILSEVSVARNDQLPRPLFLGIVYDFGAFNVTRSSDSPLDPAMIALLEQGDTVRS